jgi:hypothetical protein
MVVQNTGAEIPYVAGPEQRIRFSDGTALVYLAKSGGDLWSDPGGGGDATLLYRGTETPQWKFTTWPLSSNATVESTTENITAFEQMFYVDGSGGEPNTLFMNLDKALFRDYPTPQVVNSDLRVATMGTATNSVATKAYVDANAGGGGDTLWTVFPGGSQVGSFNTPGTFLRGSFDMSEGTNPGSTLLVNDTDTTQQVAGYNTDSYVVPPGDITQFSWGNDSYPASVASVMNRIDFISPAESDLVCLRDTYIQGNSTDYLSIAFQPRSVWWRCTVFITVSDADATYIQLGSKRGVFGTVAQGGGGGYFSFTGQTFHQFTAGSQLKVDYFIMPGETQAESAFISGWLTQ